MSRTLCIPHVPDDVAERLKRLASRAGLPLSTFALQELSEAARRADNADLLQAPDLIDAELLSVLLSVQRRLVLVLVLGFAGIVTPEPEADGQP